jgi:hypothetical protein
MQRPNWEDVYEWWWFGSLQVSLFKLHLTDFFQKKIKNCFVEIFTTLIPCQIVSSFEKNFSKFWIQWDRHTSLLLPFNSYFYFFYCEARATEDKEKFYVREKITSSIFDFCTFLCVAPRNSYFWRIFLLDWLLSLLLTLSQIYSQSLRRVSSCTIGSWSCVVLCD